MAKKKEKVILKVCKECLYSIVNGTYCRLKLQDERVLKESAKVSEADCMYFRNKK